MKIMVTSLQKIPCMYCYTHCPQPCSKQPPAHASTADSYIITGKSGSVSCGVTAPFSWVLVHRRFFLCPPRVFFPVLCKVWHLYGYLRSDKVMRSERSWEKFGVQSVLEVNALDCLARQPASPRPALSPPPSPVSRRPAWGWCSIPVCLIQLNATKLFIQKEITFLLPSSEPGEMNRSFYMHSI